MAQTVHVLHVAPQTGRAKAALQAISAAAAHARHVVSDSNVHGLAAPADVLVLWGPGEPSRIAITQQHVATGKHVVALDLAYWQRETKFRVSIDAAHPHGAVMRRDLSPSRLLADGIRLEHAWEPTGPVIVAGIGDKATVQYGAVVRDWEDTMIAEARARGYAVQYRRKKQDGAIPHDVTPTRDGPIDPVLRGAALVITWHSNVAVDAIRLGIPVICRDGAAAAICPPTWPERLAPPDDALRARFLANLAWFQWAPSEADACWAFLLEVLA